MATANLVPLSAAPYSALCAFHLHLHSLHMTDTQGVCVWLPGTTSAAMRSPVCAPWGAG